MKPVSTPSPPSLAASDDLFGDHLLRGEKLLIPYLMSGFPTPRDFREIARRVLATGPAALEIGVPFSDPLADGPVIQAAGQQALAHGTDLTRTFAVARELAREFPKTPLLVMSYINPLQAFGFTAAAKAARRSGIRGFIVPDRDLLGPDEILEPTRRAGLVSIPLVAPTTPEGRLPELLVGAGGFVYVVSVTGTTGARRGQQFHLRPTLAALRRATRLPLCVGFGIASGAQAAAVTQQADGVVVGSALLEPFLKLSRPRAVAEMLRRLTDLRAHLQPRASAVVSPTLSRPRKRPSVPR